MDRLSPFFTNFAIFARVFDRAGCAGVPATMKHSMLATYIYCGEESSVSCNRMAGRW